MARKFLFLSLVLALFSIQAAAGCPPGYPVIIGLPLNADVPKIASEAGGCVVDSMPGMILVNLPNPPTHFWDTAITYMEANRKTRLARQDSNPHAIYFQVNQSPSALWYQSQPNLQLVHLPGALQYSTGRAVVVADIDSRVDLHPMLLGHLTSGYDFVANKPGGQTSLDDSSASYLDDSSASYLDQSSASYLDSSGASYLDDSSASYLDSQPSALGHATLCAGIIAAVAPDAMIMPLRAFDDNGVSDLFMISKAIRYAVDHGAQVINMSFGTAIDSSAIRKAIAYALANNVAVIASAGNSNTSLTTTPQYPAAYPGVITAAATNLLYVKAPFSNYGNTVDVDAPGVNIISTFPGNLYALVSGTSFSAPIVAGEAALLRSQSSVGVESRIDAGAINIDLLNPVYPGQLGHGIIDILRSVHPQ